MTNTTTKILDTEVIYESTPAKELAHEAIERFNQHRRLRRATIREGSGGIIPPEVVRFWLRQPVEKLPAGELQRRLYP